jgi:hypothetical protein
MQKLPRKSAIKTGLISQQPLASTLQGGKRLGTATLLKSPDESGLRLPARSGREREAISPAASLSSLEKSCPLEQNKSWQSSAKQVVPSQKNKSCHPEQSERSAFLQSAHPQQCRTLA